MGTDLQDKVRITSLGGQAQATRSLRIACVLDEFPMLSETFLLNQMTGLIDRGCELDLYAFGKRDRSQAHEDVLRYKLLDRTRYAPPPAPSKLARMAKALGIGLKHPLYSLRAVNVFKHGSHARSLRLIHEAAPFLTAPNYDMIHCHFGHIGQKVARLRQLGLLKGPLVVSFYGFDISQRPQIEPPGYYDTLFEQATAVLALSQVMADQLIALGCPASKVHIHHLGVDPARFEFLPRTKKNDEPAKLLSIARLAEKKGLIYAIDAIAKVAAHRQDFHYKIIGDGPLRNELQQRIDEKNLGHLIELAGWQTQQQVVPALREAHLLLAPSVTATAGDQEGTPTAIVEAMMMGLPVLSTYHSGIPEMIQDGQSGHLVPERDVEALAQKLSHLLDHPDQWQTLGKQGNAYACEHFNIDKLNDQQIQNYRQWCQKPLS